MLVSVHSREADRLIEAGRVEVDQVKAVPGMQVEETCVIRIDGKKIEPTEKKVLLAFHKPRGVECTTDIKVKNNVISYVNYPVRYTMQEDWTRTPRDCYFSLTGRPGNGMMKAEIFTKRNMKSR